MINMIPPCGRLCFQRCFLNYFLKIKIYQLLLCYEKSVQPACVYVCVVEDAVI